MCGVVWAVCGGRAWRGWPAVCGKCALPVSILAPRVDSLGVLSGEQGGASAVCLSMECEMEE